MDNSNNLPELDFLKDPSYGNNASANIAAADSNLPELDFLKDPAYANADNNQSAAADTASPEVNTASPEMNTAPPEVNTVPPAAPAAPEKPAMKYGRRMDYKTAKVTEGKASSMLNVTPPSRIHNPLPAPKKRVPKEMEFDIQPASYEMHFDIVDLNGMDFFDIN